MEVGIAVILVFGQLHDEGEETAMERAQPQIVMHEQMRHLPPIVMDARDLFVPWIQADEDALRWPGELCGSQQVHDCSALSGMACQSSW